MPARMTSFGHVIFTASVVHIADMKYLRTDTTAAYMYMVYQAHNRDYCRHHH